MMGTKEVDQPLAKQLEKSRWIPSPLFFKNEPGFLVDFQETMERSWNR